MRQLMLGDILAMLCQFLSQAVAQVAFPRGVLVQHKSAFSLGAVSI